MCVCVVGKMAKDIGMTIRKNIVVTLFGCFLGGGGGRRKPWIVVVAQLQLANYIHR